jgi:leucyl-tRNA synthetase
VSELKEMILSRDSLKKMIKLLAPIAPYMSEEWWSSFAEASEGYKSVHEQEWPKYDENYLVEAMIKIAVSINGKVRDEIEISSAIKDDKEAVEALALKSEKIKAWLEGKEVKKQIYVPGRVVNLVVG